MKHFSTICGGLLLLAAFIHSGAKGQSTSAFNFNIYNGLPSNQVYGVISDRFGYLWVATEKGVVKYNGYDFTVFNSFNGIPNEDVWQLFEDIKGRIWLGSISNELGYLKDNKYHSAYLRGKNYTIYPKSIKSSDGGILFTSDYIGGNREYYLGIEKNDTIDKLCVADVMSQIVDRGAGGKVPDREAILIPDKNGRLIVVYRNSVYKIIGPPFGLKLLFELDSVLIRKLRSEISGIVGDNLITYSKSVATSYFTTVSLRTGQKRITDLKQLSFNDNIHRIYFDNPGKVFYVFGDRHVFTFENGDEIKYLGASKIDELLDEKGLKGVMLTTFFTDEFWGSSVATQSNGFWLNNNLPNKFIKEDIVLNDNKFVGGVPDQYSFWWNQPSNTLTVIGRNLSRRQIKLPSLSRIFGITPLTGGKFFVGAIFPCALDINNGMVSKLPVNIGTNVYSSLANDSSGRICISSWGFYKIDINGAESRPQFLDLDRYQKIAYDSGRKEYWAYKMDKVHIYGPHRDTVIPKEKLPSLGVREIEKIDIDPKYGNVFLKGGDNIVLFDQGNNLFKPLFSAFNFKDSKMLLYKNMLVVAGRFGVVFSKISGRGVVSAPVVYHNFKNKNYNYVYACDAINDRLIMNTDKGVYTVKLPGDSTMLAGEVNVAPFTYKFTVNYRDTISAVKSGDTIRLSQKDHRLLFDVINPRGNGRARYSYKLRGDSVWRQINASELTLPSSLVPDNYYSLVIRVRDDVWNSDDVLLTIFIEPYWYQSHAGKRIVWLMSIVVVVILFLGAVLVTRYVVLRANKKRNLRMELELKSIYAQINPHFIFNTLNSALLLVGKNKTDEAYTHISKFSRLLRSYIKSSRNKYISISEEVKNLRDYIELQQTRFKNKLAYSINVEEGIAADQIMIPSLLLQPFVENAINHGILPKKEGGMLRVEFRMRDQNEIICIIEDDGVGRKASELADNKPGYKEGSYGDLMINDLVKIFNKFERMNIEIRFVDKQLPLSGTVVTIIIKNPHHAE